MKVYVDELPKCCLMCKFACPYEERCVDTITMNCDECVGRPKNCPLKSLKDHDRAVKQHAYKKGYNDMRIQYELGDYTKQVRKEVIDKVYKVLEQAVPHDLRWSWAVIKKELDKLKD